MDLYARLDRLRRALPTDRRFGAFSGTVEETRHHEDPTFQTVRLSKGKHGSPWEGACVMELASMLAGRKFSDWVPCVDPAIGAFLRGYNDHLSDELRQDLYRYAARVLDTWVDLELAERRAAMCRTWARQAQVVRPRLFPRSLRFRPQGRFEFGDCEFAGVYAARFARRDHAWHTWTLGFIDALCWVGRSDQDDELLPPAPPDASSLSVAPEVTGPHPTEVARHAEEAARHAEEAARHAEEVAG